MDVILGIDIGGSTTKIVGLRSDGSVMSMLRVRAEDQVTSLYGALGNYLTSSGLTLLDVRRVVLTGVGASYVDGDIFGLPTCKVDEFSASGTGALALSGQEQAVVVTMGTGTAFMWAERGGAVRHLCGSGIGGGTLGGLCRKLVGMERFGQIKKLAEQGDLGHVDLTIADITCHPAPTLDPTLTAANFGNLAEDASPADLAAGALHDIATPVFAHVVDFLRGDHLRQEATEERTADIIAQSTDIQAVLTSLGLRTADVADYHRYPIADNDTPRLSADRLEYTLGNLVNYEFLTAAQAACFYRNLTVLKNEDGLPELAFQTPETASAFTEAALGTARIYVADEDRFAMQVLADMLHLALDRGILTEADLYGTEPEVIQKLLGDSACGPLWLRFRGYSHITRHTRRPPEGRWLSVPAKLRYIDPLAAGAGRVSRWDPHARALLEEFRATTFDVWLGPV